jgi:DNA-binding LacI/PurR family transcriptional regulator
VLDNVLSEIGKYKKLVLIFPIDPMSNMEISTGFEKFCKKHKFNYDLLLGTSNTSPTTKELYIIIDDDDLAEFIKICGERKLKIVSDIGIISYNDTILKEVLTDGITVISTDFKFMGERIAEMILNKEKIKLKNPFKMIRRKSF